MNDKPTRWDYLTTAFVLVLFAVWAVYDYQTEPGKIPFEPLIGVVSYGIILWGFVRLRNYLSSRKANDTTTQSAKSIYNVGKIKTANFSIFVNGGSYMAVVALLAIAIWQKDELKDALGFNRFFRANDDNFKILVLPFKQMCTQDGKSYDAGFVVTERLNDIINKEKLKIKTYYWEKYDFNDFSDETAKKLRKYHNADMVVFGAYQTGSCSSDGSQVCINYITDEKWNVGEFGTNLNRDYQKGGIDELKTGKLQEKIENLATLISLIAQVKDMNHADYLKKLNFALNEGDLSKNSQAAIYIEIADKLREEGKLEELLLQYNKALKIYFANNDKDNIALCYERLGTTYTALGNLDKALGYYEERNKLGKELYTAYPNNVSFKNGLAISYSKLGETHSSLGNLDKALGYYEKDIELTKELYTAYPNNVSFKNGLAISYEKLGSTHSSLGNLDKALGFFEDYNRLEKELYADYPNNVDFKNGLAISYEKLGSTHSSLGNLDKALGFFEERNKLGKELYAYYPNNVSFKNGLAISYSKLGETHSSLGNLDKALGFFEDETKLFEELYTAYPNNVSFKNGLAISYSKLGDTHSSLGNLDKALAFFEERNKLGKELYVTYPNNVSFKNGLAISYYKLGAFSRDNLKDKTKARAYFKQAESLWLELVRDAPQYVKFQKFLGQVQREMKSLD